MVSMFVRRQWYDVNDSLCSDCSNIKKYRKLFFDILFAKLMTKRKYATTFGTKHNNNNSNNNMIMITGCLKFMHRSKRSA